MSHAADREAVLTALAVLWAQYPEQRFTQLVQNVTRDEDGGTLDKSALWNVSDRTLLRQTIEFPSRIAETRISNSTTLVQPCPECVAGKCPNCDGESWDVAADAPATCPCHQAGHPRRTT